MNYQHFGAIVVGGGFYGGILAADIRAHFDLPVLLVEQQDALMSVSSYHNQARVHNGYHYPRSLLTGARSRANFDRFVEDFRDSIDTDVEAYYAIARRNSHVTAAQFRIFCDRIGAPWEPAEKEVVDLFDPQLVESVYRVREYVFNADILRQEVWRRLEATGVEVRTGATAEHIKKSTGGLELKVRQANETSILHAPLVFNCTYAGINGLLRDSHLPQVALKHEWTEMALVNAPATLAGKSFTVMCGPFFSLMPFPATGQYTLSHVRYTPHCAWQEPGNRAESDGRVSVATLPRTTRFQHMQRDAARYLPAIAEAEYSGSLWSVKTILPRNEVDDGRPILFKQDVGLRGLTCIMGSKLDNVYDMLDFARAVVATTPR